VIGQQDAGLYCRSFADAEDAPHRLMIETGAQGGFASNELTVPLSMAEGEASAWPLGMP
jgi:hypothetical protein